MNDFDYDYEQAPLVAGDEVPRVRPRRQRAFTATDGETGWAEEVLGWLDMRAKQPWRAHAACAGMDPNLFVTGRGELTKRARETCAECPVQVECLDYAMKHPVLGTWGGKSERWRRLARRQRGAA